MFGPVHLSPLFKAPIQYSVCVCMCVLTLHICALPVFRVPSFPLALGAQVAFRGHHLTNGDAVCC